MTTTTKVQTQSLKRAIEVLWGGYDANHDIDIDFNWVDAALLRTISTLVDTIELMDKRINGLEHGYDAKSTECK